MEKRLTSAIILTAMFSGMALTSTACGQKENGGKDVVTDSTSVGKTTDDPLADNLPDVNYNDADVTLLVRTERLYYMKVDEETGEPLNDAVYKHNLAIEQRFGVKLNYHNVASDKGQSVAGDIDGNGVIDENDRFGLYINEQACPALYYSLGFSLISNKNGNLSVNPLSERDTALNELIVKLFNNNNSNLFGKDVTVDFMTTAAYKPFNQNNLLFTFFALTAVEAMRMTDDEFGIVPVPKFDTEQEWISSNYGCTLSAIPVNTPDVDRSAIILEALNAESYRSVTPVYYESVLKGKLARDNDSEEMLDMIFGNLQFDFGFIHSNHLSGIPADFTAGTDTDMASKYASKLETLKGKLEELQKAYDEMK